MTIGSISKALEGINKKRKERKEQGELGIDEIEFNSKNTDVFKQFKALGEIREFINKMK